MVARSPEAWWPLFRQAIAAGDVEAALRLYEPAAAFANAAGLVRLGRADLRRELEPMAEAAADFRVTVRKIIQSGDLALLQSEWSVERPAPGWGYALEVLRRQADGRWLLAIGDPFTIGQWFQSRHSARPH
ncbi:MAG TPA: nuclear transport factor 2 family protein [Thermomicrobiales bacterium]|nr:nuclear transport factor 2 family protein [Thermomicrobiales bacterium]